jgi:pimeloyl-ACP methyl ester carboxylesterase
MSGARGKKIQLDGVSVFARETGDGPPVLLINGLGAHSGMWSTLEQTLEGFRLVEFDLPGAGQSDVPWKPISIKRLAALSVQVMDHFGLEQPDVLGYSMGGIVCQQLAADAPERVRRVVLVSTTPGVGQMQGSAVAIINILTPMRYISRHAYVRTIGSLVGGRARHDKPWVAAQGALRLEHAPSWRGYAGQLMSMSRWSALPILSGIKHPVLVVTGDDDPLTPVVNGMILTHMLPNARLLVCPGEGHLMVMDEDSVAHPAIAEFLAAESVKKTKVWRHAVSVDAEELRVALFGAPLQLPPMSVFNAIMRRRWLGDLGQAGSSQSNQNGHHERTEHPTRTTQRAAG